MNKMYFLLTNDVELTSLALNREDPSIADEIYKVGLPRLLDLYSKHDVEATFFFTGNIVEIKPELVDMVKDHDHEIGCHGYHHNSQEGFDMLPYDKQVEYLSKSKRIIEDVSGRIESFRSPELRINKETVKALEVTGFKIDSSVASQRFDGPFSFGTKEKMKWMRAPRKPYYLSYNSPFTSGKSKILEIPISALIIPYIGTTMRIMPSVIKVIQKMLFHEAKNGKPIVFLFHPNECLDSTHIERTKSAQGISSIFRDTIRQKLKLMNMGKAAIKLMEGIIKDAKGCGFEFVSVKHYSRIWAGGQRFR
jgi:peptidoglycan/xylan/chitin deacetylase (PgdA/CDA1 family)